MNHQPENVITSELVIILNKMSATWTLEQHQRPFRDSQKNPDVLMTKAGHEPVAIEAKYADPQNEKRLLEQATTHIGRELKQDYSPLTNVLHTAMAIRYPVWLRDVAGRDVARKLRDTDELLYLLIGQSGGEGYQFPRTGWAKGTVADIANALHVGAIPRERIDKAAEEMEYNIGVAAGWLEAAIKERPIIGKRIETILHQEAGEQTYRMAMLIVTDAFLFQSSLAGKPGMEQVQSLKACLQDPEFSAVVHDWETILKVNYIPIFEDAKRIIEVIATDDRLIDRLLGLLCAAAEDLVETGLAQIHELAGEVFQKLIVDRKYIKANYTLPTSAALLATLVCPALPEGKLPKVADFACGTGSLLNSVYKRVQRLYEQGGGNCADIHQEMLENKIGGSDVMPNATHITFASLASAHPGIPLGATRIITAPYGKQDDDIYALGSLELLDSQELFDPMELTAEQVNGNGNTAVVMKREFPDGEMDIVIQNPPFIRPGSDVGRGIPKTTFQGTQRPEKEQKAMQAALGRKQARVAHGQAGFVSYFVELADKKLSESGTLGFILPARVLNSPPAQKLRDMLATEYHDVAVITIAAAKGRDCSFSADTDMAECMIVAKKGKTATTGRGKFICLNARPQNDLEAIALADYITKTVDARALEDAPSGGNIIRLGDELVGQMLRCPLPVGEPWIAVRIKSMALLQTFHQLASEKTLWVPTHVETVQMPVCRVDEIATPASNDSRGVFEMVKGNRGDGYPCLWNANSYQQRAMVVLPDSRGIPIPGAEQKVRRRVQFNSRAHYNVLLGMASHSVAVLLTEAPAIGAKPMTNVWFENPRHEIPFTLWCNSTLGLLCHWGHCNKQQTSRGMLSLETLRSLPTLDVRALSDAQLSAAETVFADMKYERMLPFNECWDDDARKRLDERLLIEVLGITDPGVHAAMQTLRDLLSAEPSVNGAKKSRCDLLQELESLAEQGIVLPGITTGGNPDATPAGNEPQTPQ